MKKIDTHQHYWRYEAGDFPWIDQRMTVLSRNLGPADVVPDLNSAGVGATVAVQARCVPGETDFLLELSDQNSLIAGVIGWAELGSDTLCQDLDRWAQHPKLRGFRHILQDEPSVTEMVEDPAFNRGVGNLQERRLVYDVLVFSHQLPSVADFCARHGRHWLVLDHVGKPEIRNWWAHEERAQAWKQQIQSLAALPHVMCKLSGLVTEADWGRHALRPVDKEAVFQAFDHALDMFGPKRLMYGSDWPVCLLAATYETVHGMAEEWASSRLSIPERADFWSGNAIRCYDLDTTEYSKDGEEK